MKWLLTTSLLLASFIGRAQSFSALPPVRGYTFYGSPLLYTSLADTARRQTLSSRMISPGGHAYVIKRFNSHWYIVSLNHKGTIPYYYLHRSSFIESAPFKAPTADSAWH